VKDKLCCVCNKKKATNIPFTNEDGSKTDCFINKGACDKSKCILIRMREVG
jgi:hypothetical protein